MNVIMRQLSDMLKDNVLLRELAVLFASTGFYEQSIRIRNHLLDPFERIIEYHLLPNADNITVIFYQNEFAGFAMTHLIQDMIAVDLSQIPSMEQINWSNHGKAIYDFYKVYFHNHDFSLDNVAIKPQFRGKGIYSNIIFPQILQNARQSNAHSIVLAVFKHQNNEAYNIYLKAGFQPIVSLKFSLPARVIPNIYYINAITEEVVLLRLTVSVISYGILNR